MPIETVRRVIIVSVSNGINDMAMEGQQRSQVGFFGSLTQLCAYMLMSIACVIYLHISVYTLMHRNIWKYCTTSVYILLTKKWFFCSGSVVVLVCYVCPPFIESEAIWLYFEVGPSIHFSAVSCRLIINEEGSLCVLGNMSLILQCML